MKKFSTALAVVAATALIAPAANAVTIIDDFTTFQRVEDAPSGFPNASVVLAPEAIGGTRSMSVATNPVGDIAGTVLEADSGILSFSNQDGQVGIGTVSYSFASTDLTSGGVDDRFFFALNSFDLVGAANFTLTIEDAAMNVGVFTEALDAMFDPFLRFVDVVGPVDFTQVTSLVFEIESTTNSFDGSISSISVVPLPASALLLLGGLGGFAGVSASAKRRRRKTA